MRRKKMHELALCVINSGKHYDNRVRVARFAHQARRMEYWRDLARNEAALQLGQYDRPAFTCEDINQASVEIEEYMRCHIAEWDACEIGDPRAIANLEK